MGVGNASCIGLNRYAEKNIMIGSMDLTGKPAVDFALNDSQGRKHRLQDYGGKWVLLVFHRHLG